MFNNKIIFLYHHMNIFKNELKYFYDQANHEEI
jgi:hypothetical protein